MQEIEHVYSLYRTVRQMAYTSRERGITQQQYSKLKEKIMSDMMSM